MTADYSQVEMRIMAHLSEDAGLIEAFNSGEDLHTTMASRVFDVAPDAVTPEMRSRIKAMSYGLAYGLVRVRAQPAARCRTGRGQGADGRLLRPLRRGARLPGLRRRRRATDRVHRDACWVDVATFPTSRATTGSVVRWPSGWRSTRRSRGRPRTSSRWRCSRSNGASATDGSASRLLLQVHDELVLEVADGEQEAVTTVVEEEMRGAYPLSVTLDITVGFGRTWHDAAH